MHASVSANDSPSNGYVSQPSGSSFSNTAGRLIEVETDSGSTLTDEWFSYSARGELTDVYESTPNSNGYYHTTASYFANGALNTLGGVPETPTNRSWIFSVDGEGRPLSAQDNVGPTTLVAQTTYTSASQPNIVSLGSGDSDTYGYDANTGRMNSYQFKVGATPKYVNGTLGWNPNGTLGSLGITDQYSTGNVQNCTYGYDALTRLNGVTCVNGSTSVWQQGFSYDAFGNIVKTGSRAFGALYTLSTNRISNLSANYDSNGNLTGITDSIAHTYTWDAYGKPSTMDGLGLTYDALGRMVEQNRSGTYQEILYSPIGKTALMAKQIALNMFLPLPGGEEATYTQQTIRFRHSDWQGTYRFESNESEQNTAMLLTHLSARTTP
jgi:YD repeat-containing protein